MSSEKKTEVYWGRDLQVDYIYKPELTKMI